MPVTSTTPSPALTTPPTPPAVASPETPPPTSVPPFRTNGAGSSHSIDPNNAANAPEAPASAGPVKTSPDPDPAQDRDPPSSTNKAMAANNEAQTAAENVAPPISNPYTPAITHGLPEAGISAQPNSAVPVVLASADSLYTLAMAPNIQNDAVSTTDNKAATPLSIGDEAVQKGSNKGSSVASQTIAQGGQASLSGTLVSIDADKIALNGVIDAVTSETPTPVQDPVRSLQNRLSIDSYPVQKGPDGNLLVAGQTVSESSMTSVLGALVSVVSNDIVLDGTTHAVQPITQAPIQTTVAPPPLSIGSYPVQQVQNGAFFVASNTIAPGNYATVSGIAISVGSDRIVIDGSTHALQPAAPTNQPKTVSIPIFKSVVNEKTLTPGATIQQGSEIFTYSGSSASFLTLIGESKVGTVAVLVSSAPAAISPHIVTGASAPPGHGSYAVDMSSMSSGLPKTSSAFSNPSNSLLSNATILGAVTGLMTPTSSLAVQSSSNSASRSAPTLSGSATKSHPTHSMSSRDRNVPRLTFALILYFVTITLVLL